jgi:hypothetical protein
MIPGIVAGSAVESGPPPGELWERFNVTGAEAEYTVPSGYTTCTAYLIGPGGGGGVYAINEGESGAGGYTEALFSVTTGEVLKVRVGQGGRGGKKPSPSSGGLGGWPGGGSGAIGDTYCGGGGGYSGVFRNNGTPIAIAGGGGGGSGYAQGGGAGGGLSGELGNSASGTPGTQIAGGTGAYPGSAYQGGSANGGDRTTPTSFDSAGAGSGYFGGAAGNGDGYTAPGGSGYVGGATSGQTYAGSRLTPPAQIPSTINGDSTAGLAVGRAGIEDGTAQNGGDGSIWLRFT